MFSTALRKLDPGEIPEEEENKMTLDKEADVVKSVQILTCMLDVLIVQLKIQVDLFLFPFSDTSETLDIIH